MAHSPRHIDVLSDHGVTHIPIRYARTFQQVVTVQFCWLYKASIEHSCDDEGCWNE